VQVPKVSAPGLDDEGAGEGRLSEWFLCVSTPRVPPIGRLDQDPASLDNRKISSYSAVMRRKPGTLLPLEVDILEAGLELRQTGGARFHGFQLAKAIADHAGPRPLTAHGTLYKALQRLEEAGLLTSQWEDPGIAAAEGRPRRRLYEVTGTGERALAGWHLKNGQTPTRPRLEPT
jgi:PadR family transcriptional regulator, regulatory protein PadR